MKIRLCNCGSGKESWWIYDARGIELARVCEDCEETKKKSYRVDVLYDSNYECNEEIEED